MPHLLAILPQNGDFLHLGNRKLCIDKYISFGWDIQNNRFRYQVILVGMKDDEIPGIKKDLDDFRAKDMDAYYQDQMTVKCFPVKIDNSALARRKNKQNEVNFQNAIAVFIAFDPKVYLLSVKNRSIEDKENIYIEINTECRPETSRFDHLDLE